MLRQNKKKYDQQTSEFSNEIDKLVDSYLTTTYDRNLNDLLLRSRKKADGTYERPFQGTLFPPREAFSARLNIEDQGHTNNAQQHSEDKVNTQQHSEDKNIAHSEDKINAQQHSEESSNTSHYELRKVTNKYINVMRK